MNPQEITQSRPCSQFDPMLCKICVHIPKIPHEHQKENNGTQDVTFSFSYTFQPDIPSGVILALSSRISLALFRSMMSVTERICWSCCSSWPKKARISFSCIHPSFRLSYLSLRCVPGECPTGLSVQCMPCFQFNAKHEIQERAHP